MGKTHHADDYLEAIYFLSNPIGEYGPVVTEGPVPAVRVAEMLQVTPPTASEMLNRLEAEGLIKRGPRRGPMLTEKGQAKAEKVVRQHRIIERFLTDFLGYTPAESHVYADEIGETFTDDMIERLEERLGHPERCPHGWPVDPSAEREENPLLKPLSDAAAGQTITIRRLAEHDGDLLHWFYDNNLVPETTAHVAQVDESSDTITLRTENDQRTVSAEAARGIFVQIG